MTGNDRAPDARSEGHRPRSRSGRGSRSPRPTGPLARTLAALLAIGSAAAAAWLVSHHPLWPTVIGTLVVVLAAVAAASPLAWLTLLPALLPLAGLTPWTGWFSFEESDLLVLALAAGTWARLAVRPPPPPARHSPWPLGTGVLLLVWTLSVALSAWRGVADAGGWEFGWFQAYRGPMNALRLAKPTLWLWLLWPLWLQAHARTPQRASERLGLGLALGLGVCALFCVWERNAYTGLLNFSTDYRTVGPFWEMHVGGAALDAYLALTLPFALRRLWTARQPAELAAAVALALLGAYAGLTTFSRILLAALPLGVLVLVVLQRGLRPWPGDDALAGAAGPVGRTLPGTDAAPDAGPGGLAGLALLGAVVVGGAFWMFPSSGWRGLLALLGTALLLLPLAPSLAAMGWRPLRWTLVSALGLGLPLAAAGLLLPKGPYLATAAALAGGALLVGLGRGRPTLQAMAFGLWWPALAGVPWVAEHWGGAPAGLPAALSATALGALGLAASRRPLWSAQPREQAGAAAVMLVCALTVGMFGGGTYLSNRLHDVGTDESTRSVHWREILARIPADESLWLGLGLGRFTDRYAIEAPADERPGDIRLQQVDEGLQVMRLSTGTHPQGSGQWLRLSQRLAGSAPAPMQFAATLRTDRTAVLHAEVCQKHLLYEAECARLQLVVEGKPGQWQTVHAPLAREDGQALLPGGTPTWPQEVVFSLANESRGQRIDIRHLSLSDESGREWLQNGRFDTGAAHWYFTSDKHHMPWHAKNVLVHLVYEQGLFGLAALVALGVASVGSTLRRPATRSPMAPAVLAGILGIWTVGAVDSLLDMPRLGLLMLLLMAMASTLSVRPSAPDSTARTAGRTTATPAGDLRPPRWMVWAGVAALIACAPWLAVRLGATVTGRTPDEVLAAARALWADDPTLGPVVTRLTAFMGLPDGPTETSVAQQSWHVPALPPNPAGKSSGQPPSGAMPAAHPPGITVLQVGPRRQYLSLAAAARAAPDHALIEVDPGDYVADTAVWDKQDVTVRGMGPEVRLIAAGAHAEGKGTWVLRSGSLTVENVTFTGSKVADHNGAGIRLERGQLTVRRCRFHGNENGILTSNDPDSSLVVEASEFGYNGYGDGLSHNLYVGSIASLTVTGSWFHHANVGHLLKSRARRSQILYNRLTDEPGGRASYELEFPNGGDVLVVGNLIQQGEQTSNSTLVSYGAEGYDAPVHHLRLLFNTLVNDHPRGGTLLRVAPGKRQVDLYDNLLVGPGDLAADAPRAEAGNVRTDWSALALPSRQDYRLRRSAGFEAVPLPPALAALAPSAEYAHPTGLRPLAGPATRVGALQSPAP